MKDTAEEVAPLEELLKSAILEQPFMNLGFI